MKWGENMGGNFPPFLLEFKDCICDDRLQSESNYLGMKALRN